MAFDEEWMQPVPPPGATPPATKRRGVRIDELVSDIKNEKAAKEKKRAKAQEIESSDEEEDACPSATKKLREVIEKCTDEVVNGSCMQEAPKWGEQVFGAQKDSPRSRFEPEHILWIKTATKTDKSNEEDLLMDFLMGNWGYLFISHGVFTPAILPGIFNRMAYSKNKDVHLAASKLICKYLQDKCELKWKLKLNDFREVFNNYGYEASHVAQHSDAGDKGDCGPPSNFLSVLKCLVVFCKKRLLQTNEVPDLLYMLARCLMDRKCLPFFCRIQECVEVLIDYHTDDEWDSCLHTIASSISNVSKDLVNVFHVIGTLRGSRKRIHSLRREVAFELLTRIRETKVNHCASDIVAGLEAIDPKGANVDFVQLYYHLNFCDICLRQEPSFKSDEEAFNSWKSILRNFSVRIFIGDYRPFANKLIRAF